MASLLVHPHPRSTTQSMPLELFLEKRRLHSTNALDSSIPRTVSTSSFSVSVVSEDHIPTPPNELSLEQTLAVDAWDEVAGEYHKRVEPFTSQFLPFLLNRHGLSKEQSLEEVDDLYYLRGKSLLDVATGTGNAALYAASKGAHVTATDFSKEMLKIVEKREKLIAFNTTSRDDASSRFSSIETRLADASYLPIEWTNKFDVTTSNFGVIYCTQVEKGLSEMARCTKPGGVVCISAWASKEMSNAFRIFPAAIQLCGFESKWRSHNTETSISTNFFFPTRRISAKRHLLHEMMQESGLSNVKVIGPFAREMRLKSAEEYWKRFVLACPNVKRIVDHFFTEHERHQLEETVIRLVNEEADQYSTRRETKPASSAALGSGIHNISLSHLSSIKIENATSKVAIADSGATHHLWPDLSAFMSYQKVSNKIVSLADKSTAPILGIGDIAVSLGGRKLVIRDVYHVPSLGAPLFSLRAHRRVPGCGFVGDNDCFQICFPSFALKVHDDVDSYISYHPLGRTMMESLDYIQPISKCPSPVMRKKGCIVLSASAYIAFGTKEKDDFIEL